MKHLGAILLCLAWIGGACIAAKAQPRTGVSDTIESELRGHVPVGYNYYSLMLLRDLRAQTTQERIDQATLSILVEYLNEDVAAWRTAALCEKDLLEREAGRPPNVRLDHHFHKIFLEDLISLNQNIADIIEAFLGKNRDLRFLQKYYDHKSGKNAVNRIELYFFDPRKVGQREASFYAASKLSLGNKFVEALIQGIEGPSYRLVAFNGKVDPLAGKLTTFPMMKSWEYRNFVSTNNPQRTSQILPDAMSNMNIYEGGQNTFGWIPTTLRGDFKNLEEIYLLPPNSVLHTNSYLGRSSLNFGTRFVRHMGNYRSAFKEGWLYLGTDKPLDLGRVKLDLGALEKLASALRGDVRAVIVGRNTRLVSASPGQAIGMNFEVDRIILTDVNSNKVVHTVKGSDIP